MDLTKIDVPFGELPREVQADILLAICVDGKEWEYKDRSEMLWYRSWDYPFRRKGVYIRLAPEPLIPDTLDWSVLDDKFICAARDKDGDAHAYTGKPEKSREFWWGGHQIDGLKSYKPGNLPWDQSLIWRPGHEPKGGEE